jgi:hypothetical protein
MGELKAVRCSLCGGEPEFVYYAIPERDNPLGWEWEENGPSPMILIKQIRCKKCGAVCPSYDFICNDAIRNWNEQKLIQLIGTEACEIEASAPLSDAPKDKEG